MCQKCLSDSLATLFLEQFYGVVLLCIANLISLLCAGANYFYDYYTNLQIYVCVKQLGELPARKHFFANFLVSLPHIHLNKRKENDCIS